MKFIFLTLISLKFGVYSEEISCEPFPSDLKTVKECCVLSKRLQSVVDTECSKLNPGGDKNLELEECFFRMYGFATNTSVVDRNLNKSVLMLYVFSPYAYNNEDHHKDAVNIATENCEFVWTGNLSLNLATFYDCINNYMTSTCTRFSNHVKGCDLVEEHLIKCGKIATNCDLWPEGGHEDSCCNSPKVIKNEIQEICARDCKQKEYFQQLLRKCFFDCIVRETKVISNNKIDLEIVKKVLIDNANNTVEWEKPIEAAVNKCEKNWKEFDEKNLSRVNLMNHLQYFESCVSQQLTFTCPLFENTSFCRKFKTFTEKCPEATKGYHTHCWVSKMFGCTTF